MIDRNLLDALLVFLACFAVTACGLTGQYPDNKQKPTVNAAEVVEFEIYNGNQTLPPYQWATTIRGKINPNGSAAVHYSNLKEQKTTERDFELTGEEYQKCVEMVRKTQLKDYEPNVGGGASDITLIDGKGNKQTGLPSNKDDWAQFAEEIRQKAAAR